jgi:predicted TIM-barrel fold metal-dependent hydrolase
MAEMQAEQGTTSDTPNPHIPVDENWLALRQEPIIDPELPIVDAHHHLWDRAYYRYLFPEFLADLTSGHNVVASIFVECHAMYRASGPEPLKPVGETEFAAGVGAMFASGAYGTPQGCAGIVAHADLRLGAKVDEVLEAQEAASGGRLRGIRQVYAWHESVRGTIVKAQPHLLADPAFREGFARLAPRGLVFDAWGYHTQLPEVTDLARAFPETTIVLDHAGTPIGIGPYAGRRDEVLSEWRASMAALAACPNVRVKLSGQAMRVCGYDFHERDVPPSSQELADAWRPIIEPVIALFGAERCLCASNFPVDKGAVSYAVLWNALKILTRACSADEKARLFSGTAREVYRLPEG